MELVSARRLTSVTVGLLRQELDSMVRVLFLIAQQDRHFRSRLISEAVLGEQWKLPTARGRWSKVTDRDLGEAADRHDGWSARVYRFGCSFIHLSNLHDHQARDPFKALPRHDREIIVGQLNYYHGADLNPDSTFAEVAELVPKVMKKVSSNLEYSLKDLENDADPM
jgi:hypothetical protein